MSAGSTTITWSYSRPLASVAGSTVTARPDRRRPARSRPAVAPAPREAGGPRRRPRSPPTEPSCAERLAHLGHRRRHQVDADRRIASEPSRPQRHGRRDVDARAPAAAGWPASTTAPARGTRWSAAPPARRACRGGRACPASRRGPRRGALGEVAEQRDRAVLAAPGDRPACIGERSCASSTTMCPKPAGRSISPAASSMQHRVGGGPLRRLGRPAAAWPSAAPPARPR